MRASGGGGEDRRMRTALPILAVALLAAAGCGGDDTAPPERTTAAATLDIKPRVTGGELVRIDRLGQGMGTHDTVVFGRDGSAAIIKAYGGGGYVTYTCALGGADLAALRRAVAALPLHGRTVRAPGGRPHGMYVPKPTWIIRAGRHLESFSAAARPADAAPFMRHLERITSSREGRCVEQYRQHR
jgi:hypothetical protein